MIKTYLDRIWKFIVKNLKNLILSLILSIIIWFAISIQVFPNVYDHVGDIEVIYTPTQLMLDENLEISGFEQSVNVQIQGKRYIIGTLSADDFTASLDLSTITSPGKHTVPINVALSDSNVECDILTSGLTATITVERIISKEIKITPSADGITIGEGLQVQQTDMTCVPSTITISGEESVVNSIDKAVVNAVFDGTMSATTEVKGSLTLYKSDNTVITNPALAYDNEVFTVTVPVYKVKTLPLDISLVVPSNFDTSSLNYTVLPEEITIAAPATDFSVDNLEKIDIGEVSLGNITLKDLQNVRLMITLPDGYKNLSNIGIAQISFDDVESYGKLEFTVPGENITVLNGDVAYNYSVVTSQLAVSVIGPSDVLQNMTSSDITGTVNLLGVSIEEGVKNVTVSLKINGTDVSAWVTGDYRIDIRAEKK